DWALLRLESPLDRADLELALADVAEVLRRAEEHVDQRPDDRDDPEQGDERDHERRPDPSAGGPEPPRHDRRPEDDEHHDRALPEPVPRARMEEVVDPSEDVRRHSNSRPTSHPAANARPTNRPSRSAAKAKTLTRSRTPDIVRFSLSKPRDRPE